MYLIEGIGGKTIPQGVLRKQRTLEQKGVEVVFVESSDDLFSLGERFLQLKTGNPRVAYRMYEINGDDRRKLSPGFVRSFVNQRLRERQRTTV